MTNKEQNQWAYIAALMDGEGCFNIIRTNRGDSYAYRASIMINMTDGIALAVLNDIVPASHLYYYEATQDNRKPKYVWALYDNHCFEFLKNVQPFVINKIQQVRLLKTFIVTKRRRQRYQNKKDAFSVKMWKKYSTYLESLWKRLIELRNTELNGVNSVKTLESLDFRSYRAKLSDAQDLKERVTTRLMALATHKPIRPQAPLKKR